MPKGHVLVAFGANLPVDAGSGAQPPLATLRRALVDLQAGGLELVAASRFYTTPCFPPGAGPDYVNAAAAFATDLDAGATLTLLHEVEAKHGRRRLSRWAGRTLDLDLIAFDDLVLPDADTYRRWRDLPALAQATTAPGQLILPHPRLQDRGFVLVPLADIAAGWRHPVLGQTVAQMLCALPEGDLAEISPIEA